MYEMDNILRMERARLRDEDEYDYIPPRCPICKKRNYDFVYRNLYGEVIGCEMCVKEDYDWRGE